MGIFPTNYSDKGTLVTGDKVFGYDSAALDNKNFTLGSIADFVTTDKDSDDITEGATNRYYTTARENLKANDADVVKKTGDHTMTGNLTANSFIGDGSGLTGVTTTNTTASLTVSGDTLAAGDAVRFGLTTLPDDNEELTTTNTAGSTTDVNVAIGASNTNFAAGQSFLADQTGYITEVSFWLKASTATPRTLVFDVQIFSDSGFSTEVATFSSYTYNELTTTPAKVTFTGLAAITNSTTYYIKLRNASGTTNATDYVQVEYGTNTYASGVGYSIDNTNTPTALAGNADVDFEVKTQAQEDTTKIYLGDTNGVVGLAISAASPSTTTTIDLLGVNESVTGLTTGVKYYCNTGGALTTTASGNAFVGTALAADKILLHT